MAIIEQNGITFNNVYKDGGSLHGDTIKQDTYDSSKPIPSDANFPLVNAVDIDWNGAKPDIGEGENGITTTREVLSSIIGVYSPMIAN